MRRASYLGSTLWTYEGNLDAVATIDLATLVEGLRRDFGLTVVVATHDERVASRANRILTMDSFSPCAEPIQGNELARKTG